MADRIYAPHTLIEAAQQGSRHPVYRGRYQTTKRRLGHQRGAQIAQVDIARRLAEAIRHMLTPQPILRSGGRHVASGSTLTAHH